MFIPKLIVCLREGYSWKQFRQDAGAGVVVGLVALPLAMAFAIASGLPPERGIFTAIVAGFLISVLGGSRVQIGGPTGAFVVIVANIVAVHGYDGLVLATLMAGGMLILLGLARLGTMVQFIPYPVTTGFTTGIAIIIFSGQMKDLFGLQMSSVPADFVPKWIAYAHAWPSFNLWAVVIGALTVVMIGAWPKAWQKVPGPIAALVVTSAVVWFLNLPVETIGTRFGGIPSGLPHPQWPHWTWEQLRILSPSAMTVALLASIESLLSAVVADGMIGGRHKSNMELVAQGVANLATPFFGGMPATGAIARTATNIRNGGRTPMAGIVHAFTLFVILVAAGPLAVRVPMASLAGILIVVSYHMAEWRSFRFLMAGPRSDALVLGATLLLTVFVDLTVAVEVGIVLAAFLFMRQMASLAEVRSLSEANGKDEPIRDAAIPPGVEVFTVHGTFFFGAAHKLMETSRFTAKAPKALVLDMQDVLHMDASGLHVLEKLHRECQKRGTRFVMAGLHAQPLRIVERAPFLRHDLHKPTLAAALRELAEHPSSPE